MYFVKFSLTLDNMMMNFLSRKNKLSEPCTTVNYNEIDYLFQTFKINLLFKAVNYILQNTFHTLR